MAVDCSRLVVVCVTFNPDMDVLATQLQQIPPECTRIIVDNASDPETLVALRLLAAKRENCELVENASNLGLASALNTGAARALGRFDYLLFLDQDTEPGERGVQDLLEGFRQLEILDSLLGCAGPRLVDVATGLEHGFHRYQALRWVRIFPTNDAPLRVHNVNGSGLITTTLLWQQLGGFDDALFIDHVDTEFTFRVEASGRRLYGIPGASFRHRMGVKGIRFWFAGWRVWPYRSPSRHFYLFRNTARLMCLPHVPASWKCWAPLKLLVTLVVHLILDPARLAQAAQMARGVRAGLAWPGRG